MKNTKTTKNKALNGGKKQDCFFKAFFGGLAAAFVLIILLCLAAAAVLSKTEDSTRIFNVVPAVISAVGLFFGGVVCAVIAKGRGMSTAFMCGCVFLGICCGVSSLLKLGGNMDAVGKTVCVLVALLSPLAGAKAASGRGKKTALRRKK